jgi:hypothetical protein
MTLRLYTGYFDDFGCRKGIGISDPTEVAQHLVDLALCGDPILINDGYCFSNEGLWSLLKREAEAKHTTTVLGILFETGFAKTLARKTFVRNDGQVVGDFAAAFEAMVENRVWPGGKEDHWQDRANVVRMGNQLRLLNSRRLHTSCRWPNTDKDAVYLKLWKSAMANLVQVNPHSWPEGTVADLESRMGNLPTGRVSRTRVEFDLINPLAEAHPNTVIPLWDLANQAYHMTFAAWVQQGLSQHEEIFGVTSRYPRYFQNFVKKSEATGKKHFRIELNLPIIDASEPAHLDLLLRITLRGTDLCSAKEAALSLTRDYLNPFGGTTLPNVTDAWQEYAARLREALSGQTATTFVRTESIDQNLSTVEVSQSVRQDQHPNRAVGLDLSNGHFMGQGLGNDFLSPMLLQLEYKTLNSQIDWNTIPTFS